MLLIILQKYHPIIIQLHVVVPRACVPLKTDTPHYYWINNNFYNGYITWLRYGWHGNSMYTGMAKLLYSILNNLAIVLPKFKSSSLKGVAR